MKRFETESQMVKVKGKQRAIELRHTVHGPVIYETPCANRHTRLPGTEPEPQDITPG
jgi:acyl-homoserine lactone acylase PvdQ